MKKNLLIAFTIFGICFTCSCSKTELYYSCDKDIDHWVKSNLDDISKIDNDEFYNYRYDIDRQKAIYSVLNYERKNELWIAKIQSTLTLPWSNKELNHIKLLLEIAMTTPLFFDKSQTVLKYDDLDIIAYKWIEYARNELGWDNEIYAISMTLNPILRHNGQLVVDEKWRDVKIAKTRSEGFVLACTCYATSGVMNGVCPVGFYCVTGNCEKVNNCGFLNAFSCIGLCVKN